MFSNQFRLYKTALALLVHCVYWKYSIATFLRLLLLFNYLLLTLISANGQEDSQNVQKRDSLRHEYMNRLHAVAKEEQERSLQKFRQDKLERRQSELIRNIKNTTLAAREYIRVGLDTLGFSKELRNIDKWYPLISEGIFFRQGTTLTYRNLEASARILRILLDRMAARKASLDTYAQKLGDFKNKIDSLNSDTALYRFPDDSLALAQYLQKITILSKQIKPADSIFHIALHNLENLQTRVDLTTNTLSSALEQIELLQRQSYATTFHKDLPNLGDNRIAGRPFKNILNFSLAKASLGLRLYVKNNMGRIALLLLLVTILALFLRNLRSQLSQKQAQTGNFSGGVVLRFPELSAILIVFSIFQFIFLDPPILFSTLVWFVSSISLTVIFHGFITAYWMRVWVSLLILFLAGCLDNLLLEPSIQERWAMLVLSLAGATGGMFVLLHGRRQELREKWIVHFVAGLVVLEVASSVANIAGRYNFSKALLTTGYLNAIIGFLFLWTVRLVNEGLGIALQLYEHPDKRSFYINFRKLGDRAPSLFYGFLILGWFILIGRNFYSFRLIADPIKDFLSQERTIGHYIFSLYGVFIFFLIIILTVLISKVVSFFASDKHGEQSLGPANRKVGVGSWLLLIRISIIAVGLFLAFAAAGIPMDRVTIIVGALGVGIGFGLQTIINNLVSGLILAFEKPVSVGDVVEIGGQFGTMKSIGFRSSVISRFEGADLVVPNGDLLNAHLINWTLNGVRRFEVSVGVAYGTDLERVRLILVDLLLKNEKILKYPQPQVLVKGFNSSSIDLQLYFWVREVSQWLIIQGEVMYAVDAAFKTNGIRIPFPQQDLHIVSYPDSSNKESVLQDHVSRRNATENIPDEPRKLNT